jgi:hypothetical protein
VNAHLEVSDYGTGWDFAALPVVTPSAFLLIGTLKEHHYHPPHDHDDVIAASMDVGLVLVALFVAGKLVAAKILK